MNLSILHLSDFHFNTKINCESVFRIKQITDAIYEEIMIADCLLVIGTGDLAYSGQKEEYTIFNEFAEKLKSTIININSNIDVYFFLVPGNHDCNFAQDLSVRNVLLKNISENDITDKLIEIISSVQHNYFEFQKEFMKGQERINFKRFSSICWNHDIEVGDKRVRITCINSAWMSELNEHYGKIIIPINIIENAINGIDDFDLTIAVFHHPINWFLPKNQNEFTDLIYDSYDLILSGHEHRKKFLKEIDLDDRINHIQSGGIFLNSDDHSHSEFILNCFDYADDHQIIKICSYSKKEKKYEIVGTKEFSNIDNCSLRKKKKLSITEEFKSFLSNPEYPYPHPRSVSEINLQDLYVIPDIIELDEMLKEDMSVNIKKVNAIDYIEKNHKVCILGADKSGKTSLAKRIFIHFLNNEQLPLLIKGDDIDQATDKEIYKLIENNYQREYLNDFSLYKTIKSENKILIIDDFDRIQVNVKYHEDLINKLERYSDNVIFLCNSTSKYEEVLNVKSGQNYLADYKLCEIQNFGYKKRSELIDKWLRIESIDSIGEHEKTRQNIEKTVEDVIGGKLIPSLPFYILYIISQVDNSIDTELLIKNESYGYIYKTYLNQLIARVSIETGESIKVVNTYLSELAFHMFSDKSKEISKEDYLLWHEEYCSFEGHDIEIRVEKLLDSLNRNYVLNYRKDVIYFNYPFTRYYFVANCLLSTKKTVSNKVIDELILRIEKSENSNILLFLCYLSEDNSVIEKIFEHTNSFYCQYDGYSIDFLVENLDDLLILEPEFKFVENDPQENREIYLQLKDEIDLKVKEMDSGENDKKKDEDIGEFLSISTAIKTLNLLGRIITNSYGTMLGSQKVKFIENTFLLGKRILSFMSYSIFTNKDELQRDLICTAEEKYPEKTEEEILQIVNSAIYYFCFLLIYAMIKKIGETSRYYKLNTTLKRIIEKMNDRFYNLIYFDINLNYFRSNARYLIEKNHSIFSKSKLESKIFKQLVVTYLSYNTISRSDRNKILDIINVPLVKKNQILFSDKEK